MASQIVQEFSVISDIGVICFIFKYNVIFCYLQQYSEFYHNPCLKLLTH